MKISSRDKSVLARKVKDVLGYVPIDKVIDGVLLSNAVDEKDVRKDDFLLAKKIAYVYACNLKRSLTLGKKEIKDAQNIDLLTNI